MPELSEMKKELDESIADFHKRFDKRIDVVLKGLQAYWDDGHANSMGCTGPNHELIAFQTYIYCGRQKFTYDPMYVRGAGMSENLPQPYLSSVLTEIKTRLDPDNLKSLNYIRYQSGNKENEVHPFLAITNDGTLNRMEKSIKRGEDTLIETYAAFESLCQEWGENSYFERLSEKIDTYLQAQQTASEQRQRQADDESSKDTERQFRSRVDKAKKNLQIT